MGVTKIRPFSSNEASECAADRKAFTMKPRELPSVRKATASEQKHILNPAGQDGRSEHKRSSGNGYSRSALPGSLSNGWAARSHIHTVRG